MARGDFVRAGEAYEAARQVAESLDDVKGRIGALNNLGWLAFHRGATREAMAARYDALAETDPIYAGMWRAQARILRRAPAEATANPAAAPAKGGAT